MRKITHKEDGSITQAYEARGDLDISVHFAGTHTVLVPDDFSGTDWGNLVQHPEGYIVTNTSGKLTIKPISEDNDGGHGPASRTTST